MKTLKLLSSACRYCRYYKPEGRRGGTCQMLGVQVQGSWKACALAIPAFTPAWEGLEKVIMPEETPVMPASSQQVCALDTQPVESSLTTERKKAKAALV